MSNAPAFIRYVGPPLFEIAQEQIDYWRRRRVSIQDAALSMGHIPPLSWDGLASIVAREYERAWRHNRRTGRR